MNNVATMEQEQMPPLDDKDTAIRDRRVAAWNMQPGPRVGDFCLMPDGTLRRFTYDHGSCIQTTHDKFGYGSFYLADGWMDYSGALDSAIEKSELQELVDRFEVGAAWFFHHDEAKAHNGVTVVVTCRVYAWKGRRQQPLVRAGIVKIAA